MIVTMKKADFYIFGSTSELVTTLVTRERPWFEERVHRFILIQRSELVPDAYWGFDVALEQISANDAARFESDLSALVARHQSDRFQHVLPTYGLFNLSDPPVPRFRFNRNGLQPSAELDAHALGPAGRRHRRSRAGSPGRLAGEGRLSADPGLSTMCRASQRQTRNQSANRETRSEGSGARHDSHPTQRGIRRDFQDPPAVAVGSSRR